jgi:hypothetical protein
LVIASLWVGLFRLVMLLGLCALRFRNCLWRVDLLFWLGILRDMDGDESDWTRVLAGVRNIPQGFLDNTNLYTLRHAVS